jgi:hypothetical protein
MPPIQHLKPWVHRYACISNMLIIPWEPEVAPMPPPTALILYANIEGLQVMYSTWTCLPNQELAGLRSDGGVRASRSVRLADSCTVSTPKIRGGGQMEGRHLLRAVCCHSGWFGTPSLRLT